MMLTRRQGWLLVVAAAWTWYVWLTRIWNIVQDPHPPAFKAVHIGLALVSVVLLTPIGVMGVRAVRRGHDAAGPGSARPQAAQRP